MDDFIQMGIADMGIPELDPGEYMHGIMFDLKPTRQGINGPYPTDWDIIAPFGDTIGLDSEDMLILSKMCAGYFQAWCEGENPFCIAPVERKDK